ncbi:coiled-coil domain-containing protein 43 [Microplitis demolitor]|uniref:coiled-coil domain-containing protein 43 n=1 Tax=Microplitis demolitor TaxID=69319 RepID=UPI0004CD1A40|nr:coiled-coil domain-containing protein 43 [Microplitis demolitor]
MAGIDNFDSWLSKKLESLNTDVGVFGGYIKGILESDESDCEKSEALEGIISGIIETDIDTHVSEIIDEWKKFDSKETFDIPPAEDVDVRLARMLETQNIATVSKKSYTEEERKIRDAILAQYSQVSNEKSDEDEDEENDSDEELEKNLNAATIAQQEKEKREKAKVDSQKKKEKDKEDREKQLKLKEEKKEKRKTQKVERRK